LRWIFPGAHARHKTTTAAQPEGPPPPIRCLRERNFEQPPTCAPALPNGMQVLPAPHCASDVHISMAVESQVLAHSVPVILDAKLPQPGVPRPIEAPGLLQHTWPDGQSPGSSQTQSVGFIWGHGVASGRHCVTSVAEPSQQCSICAWQ
jgi:hypothetical protein